MPNTGWQGIAAAVERHAARREGCSGVGRIAASLPAVALQPCRATYHTLAPGVLMHSKRSAHWK